MKRRKTPFSQTVVILAVVVAICFIAWSCYEMHRLNDLTPIQYIGDRIIRMLYIVIAAYMWRAKQSDLYDLEIRKAKTLGIKHNVPRVEDTESDYEIEPEEGDEE